MKKIICVLITAMLFSQSTFSMDGHIDFLPGDDFKFQVDWHWHPLIIELANSENPY